MHHGNVKEKRRLTNLILVTKKIKIRQVNSWILYEERICTRVEADVK